MNTTSQSITLKGLTLGVKCHFKPKQSERVIRYATDEEAKKAMDWTMEKYQQTFRDLAR
jgi:hypothetical protein